VTPTDGDFVRRAFVRSLACVATAGVVLTSGGAVAVTTPDGAAPVPGDPAVASEDRREVVFVGNNWEGTATVVDARTYEPIKTLDIVPDREEELRAIHASPDRLAFYLAVQQGVGEGNDQYVDDLFTTRRRTAGCRSSTTTTSACSTDGTWARSWPRPATPT
jgi:hypothetical protein